MSPQSSSQQFASKEQLKKELNLSTAESLSDESIEKDQQLTHHAEDLVARILNSDISDRQQSKEMKLAVETIGVELQKEAARRSALLKQPLTKLIADSEDGGQVATSLIDLKMQVEEMDPARIDLEAGWFTRILGYVPGVGTPLKRYFTRFENASTTISAIINSLEAGREQLKRDNLTLSDDQQAMRSLTLKLEKTIRLGNAIDKRLQAALETEILQDDPKYKFINEELLFPLRQRIQDLQQQLLVNQQGFLTIEMIIRNNKELARGVNRALNTTVSALQVGVTLAMALANQKIVLEKIQAINTTTESLIAGTASRLKTQGAQIQKQASSTQIDMAVLRQAFSDITAALDDISTYRQQALPQMAENIIELDKLSLEAEKEIAKIEKSGRVSGDFSLEISE